MIGKFAIVEPTLKVENILIFFFRFCLRSLLFADPVVRGLGVAPCQEQDVQARVHPQHQERRCRQTQQGRRQRTSWRNVRQRFSSGTCFR